jgi:ABC-2 type transport system permease protein
MKKLLSSSRFKRSTLATVFTIIFIAVVVLLNVVVSALETRFPSMDVDLTSEKLNTLSDDTLKIAQDVTEPTEIYIIGAEDTIRGDQLYTSYNIKYSQVANLCDKLCEANSNITMQFVDPDKNPSFISQYSSESLTSGKVLIKTSKRYKVLAVTDLFDVQSDSTTGSYKYYSKVDGALGNAVYLVNLDEVPIAAIATGHSEELSSDNSNITSFKSLLQNDAFDVQEFNILSEDIPADTRLLIIAAPTTDYTENEIAKLEAYLSDTSNTKTRSILVTCMPDQGSLPVLNSFLQEWGINVGTGMVLESDQSNCLSNGVNYILAKTTTDPLDGTYNNLCTPNAVPLTLAFDTNNSITTKTLIKTADTAYISEDQKVATNPETGEQILGALGSKLIDLGSSKYCYSSVVVLGSTHMISDSLLSATAFSDSKYVTDLVKYSTGTTDTNLGVTVNSTETTVSDITASSSLVTFLGLGVFTAIIPVAILVFGLVVYMRRRHL